MHVVSNVYSSKLDSLKTAITFLEQNGVAGQSVAAQQQYQALQAKYNSLQDQFNQTETINQYLTERQDALKGHLSNAASITAYKKLQEDIYYYRQQVAQYKEIWEDPSKIERQLLQAMKDRLGSLDQSNGAEPKTDFKPNQQRTKSLFRRLEYGTSIQSVKASYFFPATTDIGLSVGYKLNGKSVIGVGGSGKIGWGQHIQHIAITGEGMSLRSFLDVKVKGSFWLSGGWEYNYQQPFTSNQDFKDINNWKSSGLVGLTKTLALKTKGFKKYRIQLLYDFLHQQTPYTAPVKCRVGYSF